jgi:hypothetical protein
MFYAAGPDSRGQNSPPIARSGQSGRDARLRVDCSMPATRALVPGVKKKELGTLSNRAIYPTRQSPNPASQIRQPSFDYFFFSAASSNLYSGK